jgi:hypothetical protein
MSYNQLRESFPEHMINTAVEVIRACIEDDDEKHSYVGNVEEFIPHSYVVAAVCIAMQESYKSGYADCFARHGKK